jgi:hypothetical protein
MGGHHVRASTRGRHRSYAIPGSDTGALGRMRAAEQRAALPRRSTDSRGDHPRHAPSRTRPLCRQGPCTDRDPMARRVADQRSSRSARCSASSPARPAAADGQRPPRVVSFAGSPRRLGCGGGLRRTSSGMLMRSRWRTKGFHCRLFRGSSGIMRVIVSRAAFMMGGVSRWWRLSMRRHRRQSGRGGWRPGAVEG